MSTRLSIWRVPIALVALGTVPVVAGSVRLVDLAGGATGMPVDARYTASPLPVVLHICCATVFAMLAALQFAPSLRRRRPGWHRRAGRLVVVAGVGVALSALWLNQFYPRMGAAREVLYPLRVVSRRCWPPSARRRRGTASPVPATPGVDDPVVRHRSGGRHPGVHTGFRRQHPRARRGGHGAADGRRVGHQPRGGGVGHPAWCAASSEIRCGGARCRWHR